MLRSTFSTTTMASSTTHDADAQHQAEQSEHVDREAEQIHATEGGDPTETITATME
ncbi:MAG: hypothetical protein R3F40_17810 [Candidatus Competibacteraceae bacterium]